MHERDRVGDTQAATPDVTSRMVVLPAQIGERDSQIGLAGGLAARHKILFKSTQEFCMYIHMSYFPLYSFPTPPSPPLSALGSAAISL